jgi:hypothetical protein
MSEDEKDVDCFARRRRVVHMICQAKSMLSNLTNRIMLVYLFVLIYCFIFIIEVLDYFILTCNLFNIRCIVFCFDKFTQLSGGRAQAHLYFFNEHYFINTLCHLKLLSYEFLIIFK